MKKLSILLMLACGVFAGCNRSQQKDFKGGSIDEIVASMSLEDKVQMVIGSEFEGRPDHGVGASHAMEDLGIPHFKVADGPAGLRITAIRKDDPRTYYCTAFPTATAMAASWNPALIKEVGCAMGNETLEYGLDAILAPAMNIQRNPLCGRNFEYFSEDPYVTGVMGTAIVQGIQSQGVGTSIKHFAANNQETHRKFVNAVISQRALREIYLRGFEMVVKDAQPWTVMTAYNRLNGYYCPQNRELIDNLLRQEWGYKGLVITDWMDGDDAVAQMRAGVNLIMPGLPNPLAQFFYDELVAGAQDGILNMDRLDQSVREVLKAVKRTPRYKGYQYSYMPDLEGHAQTAQAAAEESIVLLKNDAGTLPLSNTIKKVALFGKSSYDYIAGGRGSGEVNFKECVSFDDGFAQAGYEVNANVAAAYRTRMDAVLAGEGNVAARILAGHPGLPKDRVRKYLVASADEFAMPLDLIKREAQNSDIALVTIGRVSAEAADSPEIGYFTLTNVEKDLIKNVCDEYHALGKKVVVMLNVGSVIETDSWKDLPDAILLCWQAGQQGGDAAVKIVSGAVCPSGKLPVSYPVSYKDVPSSKEFPGIPQDTPVNAYYSEGIYVGYRYYTTFNVSTSYEFGYGLSYTTFEYSDLKLSSSDFNGKITVSVNVKNTGPVAGKEVVQLYLSAPTQAIDKPVYELKGFVKTDLLQPQESQRVEMVLDPRSLASFRSGSSCWIADKGEYVVKIGASSEDIRLEERFTLQDDLMVLKTQDILYPNMSVKDIGSHSDEVLGDRDPFRKDFFKLDFMWRKPVLRK